MIVAVGGAVSTLTKMLMPGSVEPLTLAMMPYTPSLNSRPDGVVNFQAPPTATITFDPYSFIANVSFSKAVTGVDLRDFRLSGSYLGRPFDYRLTDKPLTDVAGPISLVRFDASRYGVVFVSGPTVASSLDAGATLTLVAARSGIVDEAAGNALLWNASQYDSLIPVTAPGVPTGLVANSLDGRVAVSWSTPWNDGRSPITGYVVQVATNEAFSGATTFSTSGNSFTVSSLTNGTPYFFRVAARNAIGTGGYGSSASATPKAAATVPGSPIGLWVNGGNGEAAIYWQPPLNNGGSPVTSYLVQVSTTSSFASSSSFTTSSTSLSFPSLTNGTTYYFRVAATNSVGTGSFGGFVSVTPQAPASVPTAPLNLAASTGNGSVSLTWSAPSSNGGAAITGYLVQLAVNTSFAGAVNFYVSSNAYTVSNLSNGTTYYFRVAAYNQEGMGSYGSTVSSRPQAPIGVPSAPTNVVATASGSGTVELRWSPPSGGVQPTSYRIRQYSYKTGQWSEYSVNYGSTTATLTGLLNGIDYLFQVKSRGSEGDSGWSSSSNVVQPSAGQPPVRSYFWEGTRTLIVDDGLATETVITVTLREDGSGTVTASGYRTGTGTFSRFQARYDAESYDNVAVGTFRLRIGSVDYGTDVNPVFRIFDAPIRGSFGGGTFGY